MRMRLFVVLLGVLAVMTGPVWSDQSIEQDRHRQPGTPGQDLAPMDGRAIPVEYSKGTYTDPDSGLILRWLTHSDSVEGMFNDDLIGEDSLNPMCESQRLADSEDTPYVYWYEGSTNNFGTSRWNIPFDDETCTDINQNLVRYFYTQVIADEAIDALLSLGHDDSMKVWLNGVQVYQGVDGEWVSDEHQVDVHLNPGWNSILVKMYFPELTEDSGTRYFSLRFMEQGGENPLILTQSIDGWCSKDISRTWVYVGGVADLPGALGSVWASDLRLSNVLPYRMLLTVEYYEEGRARPAKSEDPDESVEVVLDPFESRTWERVLPTLFGIDEPQKGMLAIRGFDDYHATNGAVALRTYNRSGAGTFGMNVPILDYWDGTTCCSQTLLGLRNGPGFRTNLAGTPAVVMDSEMTITVTVQDMATGVQSAADFNVRGYFQINDIFDALKLGGIETNDGVAFISWSNGGSGTKWSFTASVNDNVTSDPMYIGEGPWFNIFN